MAFVGCKGEPDTDPLFARLAADGKQLLLPRVQDGNIIACAGDGPMVASRFGIPEPTGPALPVDDIGFVLVPGLAFTAAGYRLGYGGGFYDRFLPTLTCPYAGVCFAEQLVDELPVEPHDIPVQQVISA
jgi:5-formyltetrahydrofolate cyclo-ligase